MITIHKYELGLGTNIFNAPRGAVPLTVQTQGNRLALWMLVDDKAEMRRHSVITVGTGQPMPTDGGHYEYIATVQDQHGFVWHAFWVVARPKETPDV
jgi:hypothetical protein